MLFQVFLVDRLELALFKSSLKIFVLIGFLSLVTFNTVTAMVGCQYAIIPVYYFSVLLHFCSSLPPLISLLIKYC